VLEITPSDTGKAVVAGNNQAWAVCVGTEIAELPPRCSVVSSVQNSREQAGRGAHDEERGLAILMASPFQLAFDPVASKKLAPRPSLHYGRTQHILAA